MTDTPYYRSLARKMLSIIIIVSLMPMIIVSTSILYKFDVSYHNKVQAHLRELVQKHKQNIDYFLNEKLSNIRRLSRSATFEELSNESFLQKNLAIFQQEYGPFIVDLGIINENGNQIAYAGPFKLGKASYSEAEWFQKAMKSKYFISDVFLGLRGLPHFIVTVKNYKNDEPWLIRATIDFVTFNNLVEKVRIGETGLAFILNNKGELQTKTWLNIMPDKELYMNLLKSKTHNYDNVNITTKTDVSGKKHIYVVAFLKNGNWMLIYQQDEADAFADIQSAKNITLVIILIGALCIIIMAFTLSRQIVSRFMKEDVEKQVMSEKIVETGKLATVGELAAGVAHEINNPVAIMVEEAGWIEDLLEDEDLKQAKNIDEFIRALKQIRTQGRRCKEITHKLLSFAKKSDSVINNVQINDLIRESIALSTQRARYSKVVMTDQLQEGLPTLRLSQSEMQQVFLNLINNALDAMDEKGGTLDISTKLDSDINYILVRIADTGPGIPSANIGRIFDPFFTTKPVGKGTGLGLSICYGIVKRMGGEIDVKSTLDVGTTFNIHIPLERIDDAELSD
ncbi:two-component system, NtrC family, sensor kinase [Candidatus Magnetomoraceae bacterium gMMP-1]